MEKITAEELLEGIEAICAERPGFRGGTGAREDSIVTAVLEQFGVVPQVVQHRFDERARALLTSLQTWNDQGYSWGTLPAKVRASLTRRPVRAQ